MPLSGTVIELQKAGESLFLRKLFFSILAHQRWLAILRNANAFGDLNHPAHSLHAQRGLSNVVTQ
jgi:hypothetical protein